MHSISHRADDRRGLLFKGSPSDVAEMYDSLGGDGDGVELIEIAGLSVTDVHRAAKHDGKPAIGFTLSDQMTTRPMGRLVLVDTEDWHDEAPEWTVWYEDEATAAENHAILLGRMTRPKVISVTAEMEIEPWEDSAEVLAKLSAKYGVSAALAGASTNGPAFPRITISGFTDRVEKALRDGYDGPGLDNRAVMELLDR